MKTKTELNTAEKAWKCLEKCREYYKKGFKAGQQELIKEFEKYMEDITLKDTAESYSFRLLRKLEKLKERLGEV